ncbi:MAG TPA: arginine--tRNA ligase [Coriobacteriia bacterium]|nr:arginine--tRNA ligase [Coriobacteriia bacterium]
MVRELISQLVAEAVAGAIAEGELSLERVPDPDVERPRDPSHGDWATSVALRSSKEAGRPPREIAQLIAGRIAGHPDVAAVEVAGPGFINLRLSPAALQRVLRQARTEDRDFGRVDLGQGRSVQVEFVSANPVGPMHVGHGRWAALGDSIARVLEHANWRAQREFYINDAGVQMDIFGESVATRYLQLLGRDAEFPENGYRGTYIAEIAEEVRSAEGDALADLPFAELAVRCRELGYALVLDNHLKRVLHSMGVDFDVWFSERTVHERGADGTTEIEQAIARLTQRGHIFELEGALWFDSTAFGDDKDRVLRKSDGEYTYFAADIAYHWDKLDVRGFDRVIDIWGADHHGYVARMKAAVAALGHEGQLDVVIGQLVNLFRNGEAVRMSKRTGEMVTFEELLDEVGADAARYWFLRRSTDQQVDFDIEVARQNTADNPVFYVQYAHARICSILRKAAAEKSVDAKLPIDEMADTLVTDAADLSLLDDEAELALMRRLGEFTEVVEAAARDLAPYRLARYAEDLATSFHQFYTQCRVVSDEEDLTLARLYAVDATRRALRCVLGLLGVSAPERM